MLAIGIPEIAIMLVVLALISFEIRVLVLIWQNKELRISNKILWTLGVLIFHTFAALYYFFAVYKSSSKTEITA